MAQRIVGITPKIQAFADYFYHVNDNSSPQAHQEWVNCFTPDATVIINGKLAYTHEEILKLRQEYWAIAVKTRHSRVDRIFMGPGIIAGMTEAMMCGQIHHGLENGQEVVLDFAVRIVLVGADSDEDMKISFFQTYADPTPLFMALTSVPPPPPAPVRRGSSGRQ